MKQSREEAQCSSGCAGMDKAHEKASLRAVHPSPL
jgi:hypothetical protein